MAIKDCSACDDLRQNAPNLTISGLTNSMCTSLKNNTGLSPSSGNDDCEDLNDLNDCLIGNMAAEVNEYKSCEWKEYIKNFIPGLWTTLKAMICAICGIWIKIKYILDMIDKINCEIDYLFKGAKFNIKEDAQSDEAYVVLGKGCSLYNNDSAKHTADILLNYIAGGLLRLSGSIYFYSGTGTFQDAKAVPNFDNGNTMATSQTRQKNPHWGVAGRPAKGGELIYEIRIKKSQYPQIRSIFSGRGGEANTGAFSVHFTVFNGDDVDDDTPVKYAYGQHGWCESDGSRSESDYDLGHAVPKGWFYIQCRMHWIDEMAAGDNKIYSPYGWLGIRTNRDEIDCD